MSSAQRRARAKENLRRAILDAARELFITEDYKAVSMRRIAERIEYSPTAIYLYFKDKEEILLHLIEEGFALLSERLEALVIADPVERLRLGGSVYLDFALSHPHYYKLMFQVEDTGLMEACATKLEAGERAFGFIRQCVTEAQAQGLFMTEEDEVVLSHVVWAHIHGTAALMLAGRLEKMLPEMRRAFDMAVINTTLRGLQSADT